MRVEVGVTVLSISDLSIGFAPYIVSSTQILLGAHSWRPNEPPTAGQLLGSDLCSSPPKAALSACGKCPGVDSPWLGLQVVGNPRIGW